MSYSDRQTPLDDWLRAELGRPIGPSSRARSRIMERVRVEHARTTAAGVPSRPFGSTPGRGARSRLVGLALAAGLSGIVALEASHRSGGAGDPSARGFVDTVAGALADTMRVVRFMLIAPTATRVALVGDFNQWDPGVTPLAPASGDRRGTWMAAVPLGTGRHRYAFVVDDTQWIADPGVARREDVGGRRASVLEVQPPERRE